MTSRGDAATDLDQMIIRHVREIAKGDLTRDTGPWRVLLGSQPSQVTPSSTCLALCWVFMVSDVHGGTSIPQSAGVV